MTVQLAAQIVIGTLAALPVPDALPADPPMTGPLWSVVVPAILFAVSLGATLLLYRHFAGRVR